MRHCWKQLTYCNMLHWRGLSVGVSVTLMHHAVGWNEMLFGWDTHVVSSKYSISQGPRSSHGKGRFGGWHSQSTAMPSITKLLWPMLFYSFCVFQWVVVILGRDQLLNRWRTYSGRSVLRLHWCQSTSASLHTWSSDNRRMAIVGKIGWSWG